MRGSVWVYIACFLTNNRGNVFAKQKVYGFSEVRQVNTVGQQKLQYNKAINKALATYRSDNNLDSDVEVGYTHLNDGITYEGKQNGKMRIKRKRTILTGANKREVRREVLRVQKEKGESGKTLQKEDTKTMYKRYDKKVTQKEFEKLNKKKPVKDRKSVV